MSGGRPQQGTGKAADEAVRWFVRLQSDEATGEDWLAFEQWLAAAPDHAAAYERVEAAWVDLEAPDEPGAQVVDLAERRRSRPGATRRAWLAGGVGLAASLAVGVTAYQYAGMRVPTVTYRTAAGETQRVMLADGTLLRLNAGTTVTVRLERRVRHVELAEGEAAFDVAHDARRPFLIAVGDRQVRVVGTEFNLRRRDGMIALNVRRGLVEVRPLDAPQAEPTRVAMGQQLTHREGTAASALAQADPAPAFAWTEGQLIYHDAPMSQVAADLSRSLGTSIRTADAATAGLRFTGVLVIDNRQAVLRRLEAFAPVRAEAVSGGVVLRRR